MRPVFSLVILALLSGGADGDLTRPQIDGIARVLRATVVLEGNGIYGTGILVDPPRGLILTSYHVVEDMRTMRASSLDGRTGEVKLVAWDKDLDLAVLRGAELRKEEPAPELVDERHVQPGQEVFAIGAPKKLPFSVSRGIVAYVGRKMEGAMYIQLDMAINDGNSGGPVFTADGKVVGVVSFILRRTQGLSFALPMRYAAQVFPGLVPPLR